MIFCALFGENIGIFPRRFLDLAAINFYSPIGFWNSTPPIFRNIILINSLNLYCIVRMKKKKNFPSDSFPFTWNDQLKVGQSCRHQHHGWSEMINSNNLSSKRILVIFGALVISLVLIIAQHDPVWAVSRAGKFLQREVWHHSQTVGILVFHGGQRTLLECQLILIEGTR